MNQTININQKNIQHYLKDIKKQLFINSSKRRNSFNNRNAPNKYQ